MPRSRSASPWRGSASWLLARPQTARVRISGTVTSLRTPPSAQGAKTSTSCAWIASGATASAAKLDADEATQCGEQRRIETVWILACAREDEIAVLGQDVGVGRPDAYIPRRPTAPAQPLHSPGEGAQQIGLIGHGRGGGEDAVAR